jgi:hypothetical protein
MQHPIVFTKAPQSVIGPGAAIKYPYGWSELVDYEAGGSLHLHSLCSILSVRIVNEDNKLHTQKG